MGKNMFDLYKFSETNLERCEAAEGFNHPINSWTLSDWFTATLGELGEAANIAKKLNRVRDGIPGNSETEVELRAQLGRELADTFIYLDLLAQAAGIDLPKAVIGTFNAKSADLGCQVFFDPTDRDIEQLELAVAQFTGFAAGKSGETVADLATSMGLTCSEFEVLEEILKAILKNEFDELAEYSRRLRN